MIRLIYVSSATREMDEEDLISLLEQSRDRNKRQNVTGMLLYARENFFQVLEGDEHDVDQIYESILNDDRNKGNIVILKQDISMRSFPEWSMGFRHLTSEDKANIEGYTEFLDRQMKPEEFTTIPDKVITLLYQFKKNNA